MPRIPGRELDDEEGGAVSRESAHRAGSELPGPVERERPAPRHVLDDPEVQAKIQRSLDRVRAGTSRPGKTADDLLRLADEQRRVDP